MVVEALLPVMRPVATQLQVAMRAVMQLPETRRQVALRAAAAVDRSVVPLEMLLRQRLVEMQWPAVTRAEML